MTSPLIRLAHFSDIHLTADPLGWRPSDWGSKRVTGWLNGRLGRGQRFRGADTIVAALHDDIRQRGCQHQIFSGDASTMGFTAEFAAAAAALHVDASDGISGLAVPGNHDYYVSSASRTGAFEACFARWQQGDRIGAEIYPFAQRVGHCWLVAVNSAVPNALLWDARGRVGQAQLGRLRVLLAGLEPGPRILVTHYPIYLHDGRPEDRWRLLRDGRELLRIAIENNVSCWLHGHRHSGYVLKPTAERLFPIICAGSATQEGRWSWNEYVIRDRQLTMVRRTWNGHGFADAETGTIDLPV